MFVKMVSLVFVPGLDMITLDEARKLPMDSDKFDMEIIDASRMKMKDIAVLISMLENKSIEINDNGTDLVYLKSRLEMAEVEGNDAMMAIYFIFKDSLKKG